MSSAGLQRQNLSRLLSCQGAAREAHGYDLHGPRVHGVDAACELIGWLRRNWPDAGKFVVVDAPPELRKGDAQALARCTSEAGLTGKIAFACADVERETAATIEALNRCGFNVILDKVGPQTRFGDLVRYPVQAVRLDADFVQKSEGDPASASVLEGIVCVAHNMGLTTMATQVAKSLTTHFLPQAGIDYASLA